MWKLETEHRTMASFPHRGDKSGRNRSRPFPLMQLKKGILNQSVVTHHINSLAQISNCLIHVFVVLA